MNAWKMVGLGVVYLTAYAGVTSAQEEPSPSDEQAVEQQEGTPAPEATEENTEIKPPDQDDSQTTAAPVEAPPQEEEQKGVAISYNSDAENPEDDTQDENAEGNRPISIGVLIGYGFSLGSSDLNGFGFGLGLNGGYTLDFGLYLGGRFMIFFGESEEISSMEASTSYFLGAVEGGYDLKLDPILIRPLLGIGFAIHTGSDVAYNQPLDSDSGFFYLSPGVSILFKPIPILFIGGNLYFDFALPDGSAGLSLMATAGVNL